MSEKNNESISFEKLIKQYNLLKKNVPDINNNKQYSAWCEERQILSENLFKLATKLEKNKCYDKATKTYWLSYYLTYQAFIKKDKFNFTKERKLPSNANPFPTQFVFKKNPSAEDYFYYALRYLRGIGVQPNYKEAYKNLLKAAEGGFADAQYMLGAMHEVGIFGVTRDKVKAEKWHGKAGKKKHIHSLNWFGVVSLNEKNYQKALCYFNQVLSQNPNADTLNCIGIMHYRGYDFEKNNKIASDYFIKAKKQNHISAQYGLARMFLEGYLIIKNTNPIDYLKKVAAQYEENALYHLGLIYSEGRHGVKKNFREGLKYLRKAMKLDVQEANKKIIELYKNQAHELGKTNEDARKYHKDYCKYKITEALKMLELCVEKTNSFAARYHLTRCSSSNFNFNKFWKDPILKLIEEDPIMFLNMLENDDLVPKKEYLKEMKTLKQYLGKYLEEKNISNPFLTKSSNYINYGTFHL